jgi:hypothetical protein
MLLEVIVPQGEPNFGIIVFGKAIPIIPEDKIIFGRLIEKV